MNKIKALGIKIVVWCDALERALRWIVIACVLGMFLATIVSVVTRNLNLSLSWLEELARYLQICFVCFGLAIALRRGELVGTRFAVNALKPLPRKIVLVVGKILIVFFLVVFIGSGSILCKHLMETQEQAPNLDIPILYAHIPFPLAGVLMLLFTLVSLFQDLFSLQKKADTYEGVD